MSFEVNTILCNYFLFVIYSVHILLLKVNWLLLVLIYLSIWALSH